MTGLALAVLLLATAVALGVVELFIPSGGVISILAAAAIIASVVVVYTHESPTVGTLYLLGLCVCIPLALGAAIRYWPHSPLGRRILNLPPGGPEPEFGDIGNNALAELVGKTGMTKSKMLPSGAILVDGKAYDAVADGMAIEPGEPIEVVEVKANRIVVRPVMNVAVETNKKDDPLGRPIDQVIPDPFDDPLA